MSGRGERSWGSLSPAPDSDTAQPRMQTPPNPGRRHHPTTQGKEAPPTQREASGLDTEKFTVCLDW